MNKLEETYDIIPTIIKEHAGLPDLYKDLTNAQERFIMEMFQFDRDAVRKSLLDTVEDMKELVNEL